MLQVLAPTAAACLLLAGIGGASFIFKSEPVWEEVASAGVGDWQVRLWQAADHSGVKLEARKAERRAAASLDSAELQTYFGKRPVRSAVRQMTQMLVTQSEDARPRIEESGNDTALVLFEEEGGELIDYRFELAAQPFTVSEQLAEARAELALKAARIAELQQLLAERDGELAELKAAHYATAREAGLRWEAGLDPAKISVDGADVVKVKDEMVTAALLPRFDSGTHSAEFKLAAVGSLTGDSDAVFGVIEASEKRRDEFFGNHLAGVGWEPVSGQFSHAHLQSFGLRSAPLRVGDRVRVEVDLELGEVRWFVNGSEYGRVSLAAVNVSADNGLQFAVSLFHKGTKLTLV